jgi:murein L,D-transpeptidase YafK
MLHRIAIVVSAAACSVWLACAKPPVAPPPAPEVRPETPGALLPCKRAERIEVSKSQRSLTVRCVGGGTLTFPIALSRERGPKRVANDERMPEGAYRIAGPPRTSRFHVFIPIDYPSRADADRGLKEGLITKDEHAAIAHAHREGRLPPQDTPLGGVLGIHGEGTRWRGDLALNWTTGCIAVSDPAISQLSRLARPGTPVQITP